MRYILLSILLVINTTNTSYGQVFKNNMLDAIIKTYNDDKQYKVLKDYYDITYIDDPVTGQVTMHINGFANREDSIKAFQDKRLSEQIIIIDTIGLFNSDSIHSEYKILNNDTNIKRRNCYKLVYINIKEGKLIITFSSCISVNNLDHFIFSIDNNQPKLIKRKSTVF